MENNMNNSEKKPTLQITKVQFTKFYEGPGIVAFANLVFADQLMVYGVRLIQLHSGKYMVEYPTHVKEVKGKGFLTKLSRLMEKEKYDAVKSLLESANDETALTTVAPTSHEYALYVSRTIENAYKTALEAGGVSVSERKGKRDFK
jgi:hypothetical protein